MRTTIAIATFLAVGAGAAGVSALALKGSDTLKEVTIDLLSLTTADCGGVTQGSPTGTLTYDGTGSGNGQAEMANGHQQIAPMSRMINSGGGFCGAAAANLGKAEGVVFALDGLSITANAANWGSCNGAVDQACNINTSLGLASSKTIVPDATRTCSVDADCNTTGIFGETCVTGVCSYVIPSWKEALRIIFAGQSAAGTNLAQRNCNSPERKYLAANWNQIFQSCASTNCPAGIQHAFRRNDESGTTDVFVSLLGLPSINQTNNISPFCNVGTQGPKFFYNPSPAAASCTTDAQCVAAGVTAPAGACNTTTGTCNKCMSTGAQSAADPNTGALPATTGGYALIDTPTDILEAVQQSSNSLNKYTGANWTDMQDRDVIRRTCTFPSEDVCSARGDLGLVLPIWDVPEIGNDAFPTTSCSSGKFACFVATRTNTGPASGAIFATCPDGANPNLASGNQCPKGQCAYPVIATASSLDPRCLNTSRTNNPSGDINIASGAKVDARVYNLTTWTADPTTPGLFIKATVTRATGLGADCNIPNVTTTAQVAMVGAYYRIHSTHGFKSQVVGGVTTQNTCKTASATEQIGCLVQASPCSIGYAGNGSVNVTVNGVQDAIALKVNGLDPADQCVRNLIAGGNTYPLSRKLYVNTTSDFGSVTGDELKLAQCFSKRSVVDPVVAARGFVTLSQVASTRPTFCEDFNEVSVCTAASGVNSCKASPNGAIIPSCELADAIGTCPGL